MVCYIDFNSANTRSGQAVDMLTSAPWVLFAAAAVLQRSKFDCCAEWGFAQCNEQMVQCHAIDIIWGNISRVSQCHAIRTRGVV